MTADTLTVLCREGDVEANDSFRRQFTPSMPYSKCLFDFSLVQDYNTFIHERLLSTFVAIVARVALSQRTLVGRRRFRPNVTVVSGRRFRPNFGHLEFMWGTATIGTRSSANKFPSCLQPVHTSRKSSTDQEKSNDFVQTSGFTFGDNVTHFL